MDCIKLNGVSWNLVPIRRIKSKDKFAKNPKYSGLSETDRGILWDEAHPDKKQDSQTTEKTEQE